MRGMADYQILGQSNYAVAILLDTLRTIHEGRLEVDIVANIPSEDNESLGHAYQVEGIDTREIDHSAWRRDPEARLLIGSIGRGRRAIYSSFRERFGIEARDYHSTVDPRANLAHQLEVGRGVHVSPGATIAPFASLGDFVVVNRNASIGHHTVLGEFVTVNPGVQVAGICRIEDGVALGVGAAIVDGVTIGEGTVVGAGSVVTKNLPANVVAYGVPARVIRQR
jgi:sugar O-acyltransferase (sialic acid O-acetyltransferase NeuD family)